MMELPDREVKITIIHMLYYLVESEQCTWSDG